MENTMNNNNNGSSSLKFKIGFIIPLLVFVGLFAAFWAAAALYAPDTLRISPHVIINKDFEFFYFAHAIISTVNVALLSILLLIFINVYKKTKSEFSFGLIIFGFAFLLKDIVSSPFTASVFSFYASGLGPFIVLPDIFELSALTVLLYLNIKY